MLGVDPAAPESLRHTLLDQVAARLPQLQVAFDTAELQAELGAVDDTGRFFVVKLVQMKVNGHDAIDGIVEDATSPRRRRNPRLNAELAQRIIARTCLRLLPPLSGFTPSGRALSKGSSIRSPTIATCDFVAPYRPGSLHGSVRPLSSRQRLGRHG